VATVLYDVWLGRFEALSWYRYNSMT
jgi:hypothetical protein